MKNWGKQKWDAIIDAQSFSLGVACTENAVSHIGFLMPKMAAKAPTTPIAKKTVAQLKAYLKDPLNASFDVPLAPPGTPFQKRVWKVIYSIAPGKTMTYKEIARRLKSAPRAVGGACAANPCVLMVPCHRVVASHGLGGFSGRATGAWPKLKEKLLGDEGVYID